MPFIFFEWETMAKGKYQEWLTEENLILLEGWARDGLTDEQIAHNIGINPSTLYDWQNKYPEISKTLKKGKEVVDRMVENALFKRAVGYDYEEVTKERVYDKDTGEHYTVETKRVLKHVAPDVTAQIYWLKNRKPEVWREKQAEKPDTTAIDKLDGILQGFEEIAKNDNTITQAE